MTPKELARERLARYRAAHPDRVAASYQKYRDSDKSRERNRRWAASEKGRAYYAAVKAAWRPEQRSAWTAVAHAVEDGRLVREPCAECGKDGAQAHHHLGYEGHELDVIWLCPKHHRRAHASTALLTPAKEDGS